METAQATVFIHTNLQKCFSLDFETEQPQSFRRLSWKENIHQNTATKAQEKQQTLKGVTYINLNILSY